MSAGRLISIAGFIRLTALTVFVHDWFITLEDEILLIWRRQWTKATFLFLAIRGLACAILALDAVMAIQTGIPRKQRRSRCTRYGVTASVCSIIVILLVQGVLQLRLYFMYNRSKRILWMNAVLFVAQIIAWFLLLFRFVIESPPIRIPPNLIGSCYRMIDSRTTAAGWLPSLLFELWMVGLALQKLIRRPKLRGPSIMTTLVRDSVIYFIFITLSMIVTVALTLANPVDPGFAASGYITAACAIGGTRIIINMRYALTLPTDEATLTVNTTHLPGQAIELQIVSDGSELDHGHRSPAFAF
ncbi:hypothetical protein AURDEDRAFT_172029 [Auricularia subglabra TFB-10046 SS5]|nr:hypothetical protein AURDEDRAFT_172029 [Auricularia subglabra TFB-10046 SS5]